MDQAFHEQVYRREEWEYEQRERRDQDAKEMLAEMTHDERFCKELETKYPILRSW